MDDVKDVVTQEKTLETTLAYNPISGLTAGKYWFIPKSVEEAISRNDNPVSYALGEVKGKNVSIRILCMRKDKDVPAVIKLNFEYPIVINENRQGFKGAILPL